MTPRRLHIALVAALALATAACNTSGCLDNRSALPLAELYDSATGNTVTLNNIEVHGVGAPGDSLLVGAGTAVSRIYLPMRASKTSTAWCFHYTQAGIDDPAFNDTIAFGYDAIPYFASEECGAMYEYRIKSCRTTTHLIDSVVVADSLITNVDLVRIKIYFRTQQTEPDVPDNPQTPTTPDEG